ncbi:MAG: replication/maintenance protein RepL [Anaerolineae bacterium]|nr:replication/maintenance protein RepL [Anaerolineae bacterium]
MSVSGKPSRLIKPTLDTEFYIDYDWWERESSEDLRTYMLSHVLPEQRDYLSQMEEDALIDYIDDETGEVFQLDALRLAIKQAVEDPDFINPQTSLVDSVFRVFLANNNTPLTPRQLAEKTGKDAGTILKTLGGIRVYKGIRPFGN